MRVACAQINTVVGDLDGNVERIRTAVRGAADAGAVLVLTPELAITGYPPEDLLVRPSFADASREALEALAESITDCVAIVGFVDHDEDIRNAAAVIADGRVRPFTTSGFSRTTGYLMKPGISAQATSRSFLTSRVPEWASSSARTSGIQPLWLRNWPVLAST